MVKNDDLALKYFVDVSALLGGNGDSFYLQQQPVRMNLRPQFF